MEVWRDIRTAGKGGVILAVLAFLPLHIGSENRETENGEVSCTYLDLFPIAAGIICVAIGVSVWRTARTQPAEESLAARVNTVLAIALAFVGVLHILRGADVIRILSPC